MLVQVCENFLRIEQKLSSILLFVDKFHDYQFGAVRLSTAARLWRFCVGLSHGHPGGIANRILQVRDRAIMAPWHSPT